jgi:glutathione synthase/RimK-type ligase-like ATP-grasp enzyme
VGTFDASLLQKVSNCPCLFQQYVEKAYELRIIVVHDTAFAVELHSQEHPDAMTDWRRARMRDIPHRQHDLPEAIKKQCVSLVRELGLKYGALDMVVTKAGKYVFLEINPNGQYGWLEDVIGPCISESIAKQLCGRGLASAEELPTANA